MHPDDEIRKDLVNIERAQQFRDGFDAFQRLCTVLPDPLPSRVLTTELVKGWSILPVSSQFQYHLLDSLLLIDAYAELPAVPRILDPGAGSAETLAFMTQSLSGEGYGIELSPMVTVYGKRRVKQLTDAGWLKRPCQVVQGNYFPASMDISPDIKWLRIPEKYRARLDNDPYQQMGKALSDFDLIYFYQFIFNTDTTLKMISRHCKVGTHVVFADYSAYQELHNSIVPGNLQLVAKLNNPALFVKV